MNVELEDPRSGQKVLLRHAHREQICSECHVQMLGKTIVHVTESGRSWMCFEHLPMALASVRATPEYTLRAVAARQLKDNQPGDQVVLTRQILALAGAL